MEEHAGQQKTGLHKSQERWEDLVVHFPGSLSRAQRTATLRDAMMTRTAPVQGSGKQGGASSGSGSKPEWRSFNDKFLGLVRLHPLELGARAAISAKVCMT